MNIIKVNKIIVFVDEKTRYSNNRCSIVSRNSTDDGVLQCFQLEHRKYTQLNIIICV